MRSLSSTSAQREESLFGMKFSSVKDVFKIGTAISPFMKISVERFDVSGNCSPRNSFMSFWQELNAKSPKNEIIKD